MNYVSPNYLQDWQNMRDRIDRQIQQYQYNQQQQPQIQQTFQLAPNQNGNEVDAKVAETIDEVSKSFVLKPTIFVNKNYSTMWVKDIGGNIRTFKTEEVVQVDESIQEINQLKRELADVKALLLEQAKERVVEEPQEEKKTAKK